MFLTKILLLLQLLSLATASSIINTPDPAPSSPTAAPPAPQHIYTGFSYGAFWSESEPKRYKDFHRQFSLAKSLPNVPIPFTSARLYQAAQWGSPQEPSEAFQAAIDTNTTLLIGLWLPIDNELIALDKAFEKHGQKLVDLVIGIAVGNEDIYRDSEDCSRKEGAKCPMAASAEEVMSNITRVKEWIKSKTWFKLFATPPPIGHVDTARNAALSNADFVGTNIFPFWHPDPIDKAWESFEGTLKDVKQRAGDTPVWITETGWPSGGNDSTATLENMQKYWTAVGCELLGKYTTFWFELEKDTHDLGNLDWGLIDIEKQRPKIKELGCPGKPGALSQASESKGPVGSTVVEGPTLSNEPSHPTSISIPTLSNPASPPPTSIIAPEETTTLTTEVTSHLTLTSTIPLPPTTALLRETSLSPNRTLHIVHKTITSFVTLIPNSTLSNSPLSKPSPSNAFLSKSPLSNSPPPLPSSTPSKTPLSGSSLSNSPQTIHKTLTSTITIPYTSPLTSLHSASHPTNHTTILSPPPSSRSTIWITIPTGCITLSRDAQGHTVTVSNPPVSGRCSVPGYTPPKSKEMSVAPGRGEMIG